MNVPEYVTREEVQRVCQELGFRDSDGAHFHQRLAR